MHSNSCFLFAIIVDYVALNTQLPLKYTLAILQHSNTLDAIYIEATMIFNRNVVKIRGTLDVLLLWARVREVLRKLDAIVVILVEGVICSLGCLCSYHKNGCSF